MAGYWQSLVSVGGDVEGVLVGVNSAESVGDMYRGIPSHLLSRALDWPTWMAKSMACLWFRAVAMTWRCPRNARHMLWMSSMVGWHQYYHPYLASMDWPWCISLLATSARRVCIPRPTVRHSTCRHWSPGRGRRLNIAFFFLFLTNHNEMLLKTGKPCAYSA